MFGSVAVRERRSLWTILSILFFLGFVVSTVIVRSERNSALDSVAKLARDDAQLLTVTLTKEQLIKPVRGSSYEELSKNIGKRLSKGSIIGVTVWSSQGQILFSLNESLVGTTPPDMQPLIVGIAQGSGGTRVVDDTVQTFLPVSKAADGPVGVVQLDQPYAFVEARIGSFRSMLRVALAFGLIVSLLLLGIAFVSSRSLTRTAADDELPEGDAADIDADEADMEAEETVATEMEVEEAGWQAEEPFAVESAPAVEEDLPVLPAEEDLQVLQPDQDESIDQDKDVAADIALQELVRRREEIKARAKDAEHRVKKLRGRLQEAPSAPKSDR